MTAAEPDPPMEQWVSKRREVRLRHAPPRVLTEDELDEALAKGLMTEDVWKSEAERRGRRLDAQGRDDG